MFSQTSESPKPHSRGRKSKPAPVPPSPTAKVNNVFESNVVAMKDEEKVNCDKPPPGSLLKPSQTPESPKEKILPADTGSLKRPIKPAVAPRTILETSDDIVFRKPAIPERPASLQRPLSSSFRSLRVLTDGSNDKLDVDQGPLLLERTHMYTVSKQQISLIQVGDQCDDKEINENQYIDTIDINQESPNDENNVYKSPNLSSHRLSLLDTQSGQVSTLKTPTRTQRPTPPPPPPPNCTTKKELESTDL